MGIQFSLIYDVVVGALLLGMLLSGMKRGFASAVIGLASVVIAFICAMLFSGPISTAVYDNFAAQPIEDAVNSVVDEALDSITLSGVSDIDYSRITVGGVALEDIQPDFRTENLSAYDLTSVDLSKTGIDAGALEKFGFAPDTDMSALNGKNAEFTTTDIKRYGLGKMITAQVIAAYALETEQFEAFERFATKIGEAVPLLFGQMAQQIENGETGAVRSVVLIMLTSDMNAKEAVVDGIVKPCFTILVKTVAFVLIFIIVSIILGIAARVLEFVNKIPLVGGLNIVLGGVIGLVQGVLAVFVVCLVVRLITTLSGGNVIFFNNAAIESSYVFRLFYDFDFLNFLK